MVDIGGIMPLSCFERFIVGGLVLCYTFVDDFFRQGFLYDVSVRNCRWCWDWAIDALLASSGPFHFIHALYVINLCGWMIFCVWL